MQKRSKLSTIIKILIIITGAIYIINKIIFKLCNKKPLLADPSGYIYKWRHGNIHYTKRGIGKPLLLIHDLAPGSSGTEWKYIIEHYSKTRTVYCLDLIGCGNSDKPRMTYCNYLYVQLITGFIHDVIGRRTDVFVTGSSCSFVTMANVMDSSILDKIVLINPLSIQGNNQAPSNKDRLIKKIIEVPIYGTFIYNICTCKHSFKNIFLTKYFYTPRLHSKRLVNNYYHSAHIGGDGAKFLFASITSKYTYNHISRSIQIADNKIWIISGEFQPEANQIFSEYRQLNRNIQHVFIKDTAHLPHLEAPDSFISASVLS